MIDDYYFSNPEIRALSVPFLNDYFRTDPTWRDFLASRDKEIDVYRTELRFTSRILLDLPLRNGGHLFESVTLSEISSEQNSTILFPIPLDLIVPILDARRRLPSSEPDRASPSST